MELLNLVKLGIEDENGATRRLKDASNLLMKSQPENLSSDITQSEEFD